MAKTRTIVKRRKAIRNIRKITRTMELIATAHYRKAMDRASQADPFTRKIGELAADFSANAGEIKHPLLEVRDPVRSTLLLVISSNRGLCGGYNAAILRESMGQVRAVRQQGQELHLELSGKRAIAYYRFQGIRPENSYTQFEDKPSYEQVEVLANRYLEAYASGKVDRVEVVYTKYLSPARQVAMVETLLPLGSAATPHAPAAHAGHEGLFKLEYEFYPSAAEILQELLPLSFKVRLFKCFLDAAVSEQIARRVAMKAATESAG